MNRRGFLAGLAGILAAGAAPAVIANPMRLWVPKQRIWFAADPASEWGDVTAYALCDGDRIVATGRVPSIVRLDDPVAFNKFRAAILDDLGRPLRFLKEGEARDLWSFGVISFNARI